MSGVIAFFLPLKKATVLAKPSYLPLFSIYLPRCLKTTEVNKCQKGCNWKWHFLPALLGPLSAGTLFEKYERSGEKPLIFSSSILTAV